MVWFHCEDCGDTIKKVSLRARGWEKRERRRHAADRASRRAFGKCSLTRALFVAYRCAAQGRQPFSHVLGQPLLLRGLPSILHQGNGPGALPLSARQPSPEHDARLYYHQRTCIRKASWPFRPFLRQP